MRMRTSLVVSKFKCTESRVVKDNSVYLNFELRRNWFFLVFHLGCVVIIFCLLAAMELNWADEAAKQEETIVTKVQQMTVKGTDGTVPSGQTTGPPSGQTTGAPSGQTTGAPSGQAAASTGTQSGQGNDDKPATLAESSVLNHVLRSKLVNSKHNVEIQRSDPNSPLYSVKSFEELRLHPNLLKGVYGMGFNKPSRIQELALPVLLAKPPTNLIAQSQSGTGKTAAFVLAMLSHVDPSKNCPQVICLSPTFDLAKQTGNVLKQMSAHCPSIKFIYALRGERVERGTKLTAHIIIGTSGTVMDWVLKKKAFDPNMVSMFVLDEADVMIHTQGQQDQTMRIEKHLRRDCQMVLFSATYDEDVMKFAENLIKDPVIMRLKRNEETLDNIQQFYVKCDSEESKFQALYNLYGVLTVGQSMVFCHTRKSALWLAGKMSKEGNTVAVMTGDSSIEQRVAVLNRFRDGKEKVLITTNLCARGIDVEQVNVVINYDIPVTMDHKPDWDTYLHRIGRTGRFGRKGLAINFVDGRRSMDNLMKIQEHFGKAIRCLDTEDADDIEKAVG